MLRLLRKMKKQYVGQTILLGILGIQGAFLEKVTPDIGGFTDEPVVQCDVRVVKNTFDRRFQIMLINRL